MTGEEFVKSRGRKFFGIAETQFVGGTTVRGKPCNWVKTLFVFYVRIWTWGELHGGIYR